MKLLNLCISQPVYNEQKCSFAQNPVVPPQEDDNFLSQKKNDIHISTFGHIFDMFRTPDAKTQNQKKLFTINAAVCKIDDYLSSKGYEPCKDFLIVNGLANFGKFGKSEKAAGKYLYHLGKIVVEPSLGEDREGAEFIILHEQGHFLHHKKRKELGKSFKPKQLTSEEKSIIAEAYKKVFQEKGQYNEETQRVINEIYLQNDIEFVGYYFAFKNWGIKFNDATDKIYQKYDGI